MVKVVTLLAEVHSVAAVAVPVVAYPEYGLECSVELLHWESCFELVALPAVHIVLVVPTERRVMLPAVQCLPTPEGLQRLDSGQMSVVASTSCGRRLRYQCG